jgi:amino acid adenylation domain-containing protein
VLNIPNDYKRPDVQSFEGNDLTFTIDKETLNGLRVLAKDFGSTIYIVLLSIINILLSKYSGQEDIIIGTDIAGRTHADLDKIVGLFVNTLPMRNFPQKDKNFEEFLYEVKENALKAYENQDYQFEELISKLNLKRDIRRNPLFDVMFSMKNEKKEKIIIQDLTFSEYDYQKDTTKFDMLFSADEIDDQIMITIQYCIKLFKKETIELMAQHFLNLIKAVIADRKINLGDIDIISENEKHKLCCEFNNTSKDFPDSKTFQDLFKEQAEKTPENIAVIYKNEKLTYRELDEKSNQIAHALKKLGVTRGSFVGIYFERSADMIASIIGVFKAGGAYIPIDPNYPLSRVKTILSDSKAKHLISKSSSIKNKKEFFNDMALCPELENIILLDKDTELDEYMDLFKASKATGFVCDSCFIDECPKQDIDFINKPEDISYVIFTSGSTGNPKGAILEHVGMINHIYAKINDLGISDKSIIAQNASHCFDISVWQFLAALVCGGTTVIYPNDTVINPQEFVSSVIKDKVTVLEVVPSFLQVIMDYMEKNEEYFSEIKHLIVTGEELKAKLVESWFSLYKDIKVVNAYGPTEASDDITHYIMEDYNDLYNVPIGKPIQNMNIYIVDDDMKLCPIGIKGEIAVSGVGVGRGYLNNQAATDKVFIKDPFSQSDNARLYKTGDLGRWLHSGDIEFFGRKDYQVKIRGFRIELGEIESKILAHKDVKSAEVVVREDSNSNKLLCAYLISDIDLDISKLKEVLSRELPDYMMPSYFVQLEELPLTPNGKIDRKVLQSMEIEVSTDMEYEMPESETEKRLTQIWKEILDINKVGVNDNFFELGGHSLNVTTLISIIHKEFDTEINLRQIFQMPTIKGISAYIDSEGNSKYAGINPAKEKQYYEASSAQKRMHTIQQFDLESTGYNMPVIMLVEGQLDKERVENSFYKLIQRHEALRTSFALEDKKIVQKINTVSDFKITYKENPQVDIQLESDNFIRAFNLGKAPLLRVTLIKQAEDKHILMIDMHHIIADGVSMEILTTEFTDIYEGRRLDKLRLQYKDFSEWQNKLLNSDKIKKQEKYWMDMFKAPIMQLNMPTDFERPAEQSFEGDSLDFILNAEMTNALNVLAKGTESTMFMVLLSAFNILISKYSGQEDIIVGTPIAGRPHADLEKIIGMFVNTLALRNYPEGEKTYSEFLKEVRENALNAYENQDYQLNDLVEKLDITRDPSRNPLFDVMFAMQNLRESKIEIEGLTFKEYEQKYNISKLDLSFFAREENDEISISVQYCTRLFAKESIERLIKNYIEILEQITKNTQIILSDIEISYDVSFISKVQVDDDFDF